MNSFQKVIECKTDTNFIKSKTFDLDNPTDATFLQMDKSDTAGSIDYSEYTTFKDFNGLVVNPANYSTPSPNLWL